MAAKTSGGDPKEADVCKHASSVSLSPYTKVTSVGVPHQTFTSGGIATAPEDVNLIHTMVDPNKKDTRVPVQIASHSQRVHYIRGKRPRSEESSNSSISFCDDDLEGVDLPHNDALVISLKVGDHPMNKILVDPGSSVNVIYNNGFNMLKLRPEDLKPTNILMCGFNGAQVRPMGVVTLPIYVEPIIVQTEFLVVDVSSSYNAIIGRPWLHETRAIPSTYHQLLKFHLDTGIKAIRGDQRASKECCMIEVKAKEEAKKKGSLIMATKRSVGTLKEADLKGKKVFVRVDLNVPLDDNLNITDDTRVRAAVPTIKYLMGHGAKVILCSHLGHPKGVTPKYSLKPLVPRLSELLGIEVKMANDCIGEEVQIMVAEIPEGGVLLLENVRFYKEEEKNDPEFAKKLASLADLYVNDAFGTAHRAHASTEGVAKYLKPSVAGFLMQKELDYLVGAVSNPKKPFAAIVGGSKVSSKIGVIESLLEKVDMLLLGGGMIFTFYKAQGYSVGSSLVEEDKLDLATSLLEKAKSKGVALMLPTDVVVADKFAADANSKIVPASGIPDGWMGLDIGPDSIKMFGEALDSTKTIIWNGPMGVFEFEKFAVGTETTAKKLAELSSEKGVTTIIGGGDSVAAVEKVGLADKMSHISTGGGASLELLEGKSLPGVLALDDA